MTTPGFKPTQPTVKDETSDYQQGIRSPKKPESTKPVKKDAS